MIFIGADSIAHTSNSIQIYKNTALQIKVNNSTLGGQGYTIANITINTWYFFCWIITGKVWNFYLNDTKYTFASNNSITTNTIKTYNFIGKTISNTTNFNGLIDNIFVYNSTLTDSQILEIYSKGQNPNLITEYYTIPIQPITTYISSYNTTYGYTNLMSLDNTGIISNNLTITTINDTLNLKTDKTYADTQLALKQNITDSTTALNLKTDKTYTDTQLALKQNITDSTTALNLKADKTYTDTQLALKLNITDASTYLATKQNIITATSRLDMSLIGTGIISNAELNYLNGSTSNIQTQINNKFNISDYNSNNSSNTQNLQDQINLKVNTTDLQTQLDNKISINSSATINELVLSGNLNFSTTKKVIIQPSQTNYPIPAVYNELSYTRVYNLNVSTNFIVDGYTFLYNNLEAYGYTTFSKEVKIKGGTNNNPLNLQTIFAYDNDGNNHIRGDTYFDTGNVIINGINYNTNNTNLNNSIGLKVNTIDYDNNNTNLNNAIGLKVNTTDYNTNNTNINNSIALKSNFGIESTENYSFINNIFTYL